MNVRLGVVAIDCSYVRLGVIECSLVRGSRLELGWDRIRLAQIRGPMKIINSDKFSLECVRK